MIERLKAFGRCLKATVSYVTLACAAFDDAKLAAECSVTERNGAKVRGAVLIGTTVLNGSLYTALGWSLAGGVSLPIMAAAVGVSVLLGLADHYTWYRTALYEQGLKALRDGGLNTDFLSPPLQSTKRAMRARMILSLVLSTVAAVGIGLVVNKGTIDRRIDEEYLTANKAVVERAIRAFDEEKKRKQTAYDAAREELQKLASGQAGEVNAAVRWARGVGRDTVVARQEAVQNSQRRTAAANARVDKLGAELDLLESSRPNLVRRAIESSPERVPKSDTLISRIDALYVKELTASPGTILPIAAFDLAVVLLDLLVMTLKGLWVPSAYAAAVTRKALQRLVDEAKRAAGSGDDRDDPPPFAPPAAPTSPEPPFSPPPQPPVPPRRGRGRPRKNGFDPTKPAAGQAPPPAKKFENV